MENRFDFYKEFYFKELDRRDEINNSLSLPIGIITALFAGIFYLFTNFDYSSETSLILINICSCKLTYQILLISLFVLSILTGTIFLCIAIYHLIKSYSDFPNGYQYEVLPDTNQIDLYEKQLKDYYTKELGTDIISKEEVKSYVLSEMIRNTGVNQVNNKRKWKFKYHCEYYLITSVCIIGISLLLFIVNYTLKTEKKDPIEVKLVSSESFKIDLNSKENRNFIMNVFKDPLAYDRP